MNVIDSWSDLRGMVQTIESLTTLRAILFGLGLFGAWLWSRARPRAAVLMLCAGSAIGLLFWIMQIRTPLGLGSHAELTREWAQVGVNASIRRADLGFVWGAAPTRSMATELAAIGVPVEAVFMLPQIGTVVTLALFAALPLLSIGPRTSAMFAAALTLGGGLWPGRSVFEAVLFLPELAAMFAGSAVVLAAALHMRRARIKPRFSFKALLVLIAVGSLLAAPAADGWRAGIGLLLLAAASMASASGLRVVIRRASGSSARSQRVEALVLLTVFSGSGLFWWNPPQTSIPFLTSRNESAAILRPLSWIRTHVPRDKVVVASRSYVPFVAAHTGHRVLVLRFPGEGEELGISEPARRARFNQSVLEGRPVTRLAEHYSATHLLLGPGEETPVVPSPPRSLDEPASSLELLYQDAEDFRVFRFVRR